MAAFAGKGHQLGATTVHAGFAQSRASGDYRGVTMRIVRAFIENREVVRGKSSDSKSISLQIVDEANLFHIQHAGQISGVNNPWKIGGLAFPIAYRTADAKGRAIRAKF